MFSNFLASGGKGKRREGPEDSKKEDAARAAENEDAEVPDADEEGDWNLDDGAEDAGDVIEGAEEAEEEQKKSDKQDADLEELWQEKMASLEKALGAKMPLWTSEHGATDISKLSLPVSTDVAKLSPEAQNVFLEATASLSLQTATTIRKLLHIQAVLEHGAQKETPSLLLQDIEVNRSLTHMQRYIELALWRHCASSSKKVARRLDQFLYEQSKPQASEAEEPKKTFKDFYRQQITAQFGDELDQLRQEKTFDESKISLLIDVLEAGVGLYDDEEQTLLMMTSKEQRSKSNVQDKEMKDVEINGEQGAADEEEAMVNFATPKRKQPKQERAPTRAPTTATKACSAKKSPAAGPKSPKGKS